MGLLLIIPARVAMLLLFSLQLVLPLMLILLVGFMPGRSRVGLVIQIVATAVAIFAARLVGLWMLPPWWAPFAFGLLLLPAVAVGLRRRRLPSPVLPEGFRGWGAAALYLALGALAASQTIPALTGRTPPEGALLDLNFPLGSGAYLIVNGGNDPGINAHLTTLDPSVPRFRAWRGQSFGIDIVEVDRLGLRAAGILPAQPGAYRIYGAAVLSPCDGRVIAAVDGIPDMRVPQSDREHMAGNHLILRCGMADVVLGHLKPGSLRRSIGENVRAGDHLASVGNSGNTNEPHLHIHAQRPGAPSGTMAAAPLPIRLSGRYLARNDRFMVR